MGFQEIICERLDKIQRVEQWALLNMIKQLWIPHKPTNLLAAEQLLAQERTFSTESREILTKYVTAFFHFELNSPA
jgi:hypothetical protein